MHKKQHSYVKYEGKRGDKPKFLRWQEKLRKLLWSNGDGRHRQSTNSSLLFHKTIYIIPQMTLPLLVHLVHAQSV